MVGLKSPECSNCGNIGPRHSRREDTLHRTFIMGSAGCWAGRTESSWVMFQPPASASAASVAALIIP